MTVSHAFMGHSDTTASFVWSQIIALQPSQLPYGAVETNLQRQSEGAQDRHRKGTKIKRRQMRVICASWDCGGGGGAERERGREGFMESGCSWNLKLQRRASPMHPMRNRLGLLS